MHKNKIVYLSFILFALAPFAHANSSTGQTNVKSQAIQTTTAFVQIPAIIENIQIAKTTLQNTNLNYELDPIYKNVTTGRGKNKKTKRILSGYNLSAKDFAIAILDPANGQVSVTKAIQQGNKFTFPDQNFFITQNGFNGVNTNFTINKPANGIVLAIKYLITGPESGSKTSILASMSNAIYVPYSSGLNTVVVSKYGEQYIDEVISEAASQLNNLPSQSQPGETITQAIQPAIIKSLLYAEHMDTSEFLSNPNTQNLIDKLNVLYAANQGDTFKYSVSSANARGIAQFVPSTYSSLIARHPAANLTADFVAGMSDHVNSVKAEYLLIDDYITAVHAKIPSAFNPAYIADYGAASYNGGVTRVTKAVVLFGNDWSADHSAALATLQGQLNISTSTLNSLKTQYKKVKSSQRSNLATQIKVQKNTVVNLQSQLTAMQAANLKGETVHYLEKMHKLIQIFNAESPATADSTARAMPVTGNS